MKKTFKKLTSCILVMLMLFGAAPFNMTAYAEDGVWDGSVASGFASGTGTGSDPYIIETPEQLAYFAQSVNSGNNYHNKVIRLANDIVLNSPDVFEYDAEGNITGKAEGAVPNVWTPIGLGYHKIIIENQAAFDAAEAVYGHLYEEKYSIFYERPSYRSTISEYYYRSPLFYGNFYGDCYSVSGIYIDTDNDFQGLFGLNSGNIYEVKIDNSYIKGSCYVGGLMGYNSYFANCISVNTNSGTVTGDKFIGGIAGFFDSGITSGNLNTGYVSGADCVGGVIGGIHYKGIEFGDTNKGCVTGNGSVGGVVGKTLDYIVFKDCINYGSVTGNGSVGGVVGTNESNKDITECYNSGRVDGTGNIGGLVGSNLKGSISKSCNGGTVTGTGSVGGIFGISESRYGIAVCCNTGSVTGSGKVGGLAGCINSGAISKSCNTGGVEGTDYVGGVTGYSAGSISECFNTGSVAGNNLVGGIAGYNSHSTIINCYNTGGVGGTSKVGGIAGDGESTENSVSISNCYNVGCVTGSENVGGVAGFYIPASINRCYYMTGTALGGIDGLDYSGEAEVLADISMRQQSSYIDWDFTGKWTMDGNQNYPYPEIKSNNHSGGSVTGMSIVSGDFNLYSGKTRQISVEFYPADASYKAVRWSSSDISVATVSRDGIITGVTSGTVTIKAKTIDGGFTDTCEVTVIPHTHSYTSEVTTAPACTAGGVMTYTCICGDSYTETIPATGHDWGGWVYDGAGKKTHTSVCQNDASHTKTENCTFGEGVVTSAPTCTTEGVITFTCSVCGGTYTQAIPSTGHDWSDWVYNGADKKTHTRTCITDAGHTETGDCTFIMFVTVAPTCTTSGVMLYKCSKCNGTYIDTIFATGHRWGAWETVSEATLTESGLKRRECSSCHVAETETIPMLEPNFTVDAIPDQPYTGRSITPELSVKSGGVTLLRDVDYTVEYIDNRAIGTSTVKVTGKGNYGGTRSVTFEIVAVPVSGISLSKRALSLNYKETFLLNIIFNPINATNKTVTWKSSDKRVAEVNKYGIVTAKGEGTAVITAMSDDGGFKASCTVTVKYAWWQLLLRIVFFGLVWY